MNKTKVVIFGSRNTNNFEFKLGENIVEVTDKYHFIY